MATLSEQERKTIKEKQDKRREAAKGFAREAGARQEAGFQDFEDLRGQQRRGIAEGSDALKASSELAQRRARGQAAEELAMAGASGAFGGGSNLAKLREAGDRAMDREEDILVDSELQRQQFEQSETARAAGLAEKAGEYGAVASSQKAFGEEFAAKALSEPELKQKLIVEANEVIAQTKKDHKGDAWYKSDDEEAAAKVLEDLAKAATSPQKEMYEKEAKRIRKEGDFAF